MYAIKTLSLLALAGSAIAAPWRGGNGGNRNNDNNNAVQVEVAVVTAYTTVTADGKWGGNRGYQPTAAAQQQEPVATQQAKQEESSTWATWMPESSTPAAAPTAPASGSNDGYMGVVSEWRSKMGMSALAQDSQLEANALKTAADGNGQMVHQLNSGSMGQVLAPGDSSDFEKCFVGGWLCEIPSLPGLDGVCNTMSQGWAYGGQTGHAELLSSTKYSKIGCGNAGGIWACDLA